MKDGAEMPCNFNADYFVDTPVSSEECQLSLSVSLKDTRIKSGKITEADVVVRNKSGQTLPSPMVIVGIPGGLEVRHDQLKELVKKGTIAAYEVIGRKVVLYWRSFTPNCKVEVPISLIAAIPGTYTGPASSAYLYYTDEYKHWKDPLNIQIQ